eukprot:TRINITY_DN9256_c0_g1_i1.p1 TRINITY_DN9256_c0_g1~~TRINITY_DN9256_c0_g1_i1.p1  ORF type:complete len:976 (+),score=151.35 TRINITY_DN9256_c0_g1_i1:75-3002(+)
MVATADGDLQAPRASFAAPGPACPSENAAAPLMECGAAIPAQGFLLGPRSIMALRQRIFGDGQKLAAERRRVQELLAENAAQQERLEVCGRTLRRLRAEGKEWKQKADDLYGAVGRLMYLLAKKRPKGMTVRIPDNLSEWEQQMADMYPDGDIPFYEYHIFAAAPTVTIPGGDYPHLDGPASGCSTRDSAPAAPESPRARPPEAGEPMRDRAAAAAHPESVTALADADPGGSALRAALVPLPDTPRASPLSDKHSAERDPEIQGLPATAGGAGGEPTACSTPPAAAAAETPGVAGEVSPAAAPPAADRGPAASGLQITPQLSAGGGSGAALSPATVAREECPAAQPPAAEERAAPEGGLGACGVTVEQAPLSAAAAGGDAADAALEQCVGAAIRRDSPASLGRQPHSNGANFQRTPRPLQQQPALGPDAGGLHQREAPRPDGAPLLFERCRLSCAVEDPGAGFSTPQHPAPCTPRAPASPWAGGASAGRGQSCLPLELASGSSEPPSWAFPRFAPSGAHPGRATPPALPPPLLSPEASPQQQPAQPAPAATPLPSQFAGVAGDLLMEQVATTGPAPDGGPVSQGICVAGGRSRRRRHGRHALLRGQTKRREGRCRLRIEDEQSRGFTALLNLAAAEAATDRKSASVEDEEKEDGDDNEDPRIKVLTQQADQRAETLLRATTVQAVCGRGSYGEVTLGTASLVVKKAQPTARAQQSLLREADFLQRINSQDAAVAVQLLGSVQLGTPNGVILLEKLHATLATAAPLQGAELSRALRGILDAFDVLYTLDIVHLDPKPENTMVAPDGTIKLIDFGISAADGEHAELAYTWTYRPLEWLLGFGQPATCSNDWWAMGLLLYYAAVGTHPAQPVVHEADVPRSHVLLLRHLEYFVGERCEAAAEIIWSNPGTSHTHDYADNLFDKSPTGWTLRCAEQPHSPTFISDVQGLLPGLPEALRSVMVWDPDLRASPQTCKSRLT